MKVVTADEMRNIDLAAIEKFGIPGSVLMERAGLAVSLKVKDLYDRKKVIVLAGGGNNGGDGIAAARNLHNWGWNVRVLLMLREDRLSPGCLAQYRMARQAGVTIEFRTEVSGRDLHSAVVVDALLGTGINKAVTSPMSDVIAFLNASDADVISVDIPSGVSSDTGLVMGEAVQADHTVTFGLPKIGHMLYPGADCSGRLHVEDIGFPEELLSSESLLIETIEKDAVSLLVPGRRKFSHKGDYGHVLVVAGSRGKTGAALMAAKSCLRCGAGLVTLGIPETLADIFQARATEEMVLPLPDTGSGTLSVKAYEKIRSFLEQKANVLAIGPGISVDENITGLIIKLMESVTVPMVLDADAINALSGKKELLKSARAPVILTPHSGEMARLLAPSMGKQLIDTGENIMTQELRRNNIGIVRSFTQETGTYLVFKGAPTLIAAPDGKILINTTGNSGMATAGSGDVLTGMIAAFLGQSLSPLEACSAGVFLHGLAGDLGAGAMGMHSLIASDIIGMVPVAFMSLSQHV
jgi:NAD(P)H-hydrate epimerase